MKRDNDETATGRGGRGGWRVFLLVWFGQLISVVGSGMTAFALGVWVYQRTGSATKYALIALCTALPTILVAPLGGVLVDRLDRRRVMMCGDFGASLCVLALAALLYTQRLEIWHIYLAIAVQSAFTTLQWPAYTASVTLLIDERHLGRAGGMMQFGEAAAQIAAPLLAGVLVAALQIWAVLLVDWVTFLFAVSLLMLVRIPAPPRRAAEQAKARSLWREAAYGWVYIRQRAGLLALLVFFAVTNFLTGMCIVLGTPLILSFASTAVLGTILSAAGFGMLAGSLLMSAWGGPRRRVYGVLVFELLAGLSIMLAGWRASALLVGAATFVFSFCLPLVLGCSQAIWQSKVAPEVQGRVFSVRRMIAWSTLPLAYATAGPLADGVFNPLLTEGGALAGVAGRFIGVGAGRGIGLMFVVLGFFVTLTAVCGYLYPHLRTVEDELPNAPADLDRTVVKAI